MPKWKPLKGTVADCESMSEDSRAILGTVMQGKCKKCGLVTTEFQPFKKKGKFKHLGLTPNNN